MQLEPRGEALTRQGGAGVPWFALIDDAWSALGLRKPQGKKNPAAAGLKIKAERGSPQSA